MNRLIFLACSFLLVGCPVKNPEDPSPSQDKFDLMCKTLQDLQCPEGEEVYNDALGGAEGVPNQSCDDYYRDLEKSGLPVNAECVQNATSCDQVESLRTLDPSSC